MASYLDNYCERCDEVGHERDSPECDVFFKKIELPFRNMMKGLVGTVMKSRYELEMWDNQDNLREIGPGTYIRLIVYTEWLPDARSGNYWDVETLDGSWSRTHVYADQLEELSVLEKIALMEPTNDEG